MPDATKDGHLIKKLFAFVVVDEDGDEGLCAMQTSEGWVPLVGSDIARVDYLRPAAAICAKQSGKVVHLRRFTNMEIVDVIHPNGVNA